MLALLLFAGLIALVLPGLVFRLQRWRTPGFTVGFFHPYCNAGGGGERVLWFAIKTLLDKHPNVSVVVYSGDEATSAPDILSRVRERFNIDVPPTAVRFVFLQCRPLVEASMYPRFTMVGQSLGSMLLAVEALCHVVPDVWFDSMGYAFTFPVARWLGGSRVACYVHYPTISMDMLEQVFDTRPSYNNDASITSSKSRSVVKYVYYLAFAKLYGAVGSLASCVIANSTWTKNHIQQLWGKRTDEVLTVYPPCNTQVFARQGAHDRARDPIVLSIAQFRPEKNHELQLLAMRTALRHQDVRARQPRLVLVGSCRGPQDEARVEHLKQLAAKLEIQDFVDFRVNVPYSELIQLFGCALVGLHTMWNEHFGIGVVEMMAAGLVTIAHDSGGPKMDIVQPNQTGFLATSEDEYADAITAVLLGKVDLPGIRQRARQSVDRFSEEEFAKWFEAATAELFRGVR